MVDGHEWQWTLSISLRLSLQPHYLLRDGGQGTFLLFCQCYVNGFNMELEREAWQLRTWLLFQRTQVSSTHTVALNSL